MLIVTLPPVHQEGLLQKIIAHPSVGAVRYNTGMDSAYPPEETLSRIIRLTRAFGKSLWLDLKGRQLRVSEWATPPYGPVVLNHRVRVELPAKVFFRGDNCSELKEVADGVKLYLDPPPKYAVGKGQAVNIVGSNVEIDGGLTETDHAYIRAAIRLGINRFMLSFVECAADIVELEKALEVAGCDKTRMQDIEMGLKIESQKGVDFVRSCDPEIFKKYRLVAARDDLMIQIGGLPMLEALKLIAEKDPEAICASRLLLGLEQAGAVGAADISDIRLMQVLGYRNFMFSDGLSLKHFDKAIEFWIEYLSAYPI